MEVVARRGGTRIVRTPHGLVLAAAGVDASNVAPGTLVRLPVDPDASARRLRADIAGRTGVDVGIVVTDTAGRPWREGQTDIAVGCAGLVALDDHAGRLDGHGNELAVTAPAVADEVAAAAELATGKTGGRPFTVVRGLAGLVRVEDGPGARSLVRARRQDMFALGTREAVVPSEPAGEFSGECVVDHLVGQLHADGGFGGVLRPVEVGMVSQCEQSPGRLQFRDSHPGP